MVEGDELLLTQPFGGAITLASTTVTALCIATSAVTESGKLHQGIGVHIGMASA